ncbi:ABC transporter permease [Chloroflexia bacterium SDU3-3]|nr:ABC transporter permease [Chloroflexia bacterium SDU3-3]
MFKFIMVRLLSAIPVLIGISLVSFIIIQLPPGDFASSFKTNLLNNGISEQEAERQADAVRAEYGLDKPIMVQYVNWMGNIITKGEFGYSFAYKKDVGALIAERLPRTLALALASHLISTLVGVLIGIYAATRQYSLGDNLATVLAFLGTSIPRFFLALLIMYWLAFSVGSQNFTNFNSPQYALAPWSWGKLVDTLEHVWPVVVIAGFGGVAQNMRVMRGNLLDTLNMQYVTTARAKGLSEAAVIYRHATPNALHPIVMYQGTVLPYMLAGELEAAIVLGLPTLAPMFYGSLLNQDIYVSGGFLLIYGVLLVLGNLLADIFLSMLDPRIRLN